MDFTSCFDTFSFNEYIFHKTCISEVFQISFLVNDEAINIFSVSLSLYFLPSRLPPTVYLGVYKCYSPNNHKQEMCYVYEVLLR